MGKCYTSLSIILMVHFLHCDVFFSQSLIIQSRASASLSGSAFAESVKDLSLDELDDAIYREILSGNIPDFQRMLVPVSFEQKIDAKSYKVTIFVLPDYLSIGSEQDYFMIPMSPLLAQKLCDELNCSLPTRKLVDTIWENTSVKLSPSPIAPSPEMTKISVMWKHHQMINDQRASYLKDHPPGSLVSGHKKDVVISNKIYKSENKTGVVIYGWHYLNGSPIQPLYNGHGATYADYSHGIRLISNNVSINGKNYSLKQILQDDTLHQLLSDEGKILKPFYP